MRIVIDMQGAQTESRVRGIGRYTLSFAQAVARNRGKHELLLALNGLFPDTIEPIRAAFEGLLPQENIRVWYAPGPVRELENLNRTRRAVAEPIREAFLASLHADVVHISSLFEGYADDAVTSIRGFDKSTAISVTLYDLIPKLNPDQYLTPNPSYAAYYERKYQHLRQADLYLAISEHTRQEALQHLGISPQRIVNVSTAIEPMFRPVSLSQEEKNELLGALGISQPYVLYTGGSDERKNLPRLIEAWSQLPQAVRESHQLLFAGKMHEGHVSALQNIAKQHGLKKENIVFCGYVSDDVLIRLFSLCKLFVFPSWHEGFGLPALEAMACGAPVIGANTSSLPEVIGLEVALFNPFKTDDICKKIHQALIDELFRKSLCKHGAQQPKTFDWNKTALRAIATWEELHHENLAQANNSSKIINQKPRLAFVSPLPPEKTGIAQYSAELLPALQQYYDIVLITDQTNVDRILMKEYCTVKNHDWLRSNIKEIDRVVYQMGNSPFHQHMLALMPYIPGTVVLHDFYLSSLKAWLELEGGCDHAWSKSLYEAHGYKAVIDRVNDAENVKRLYPANFDVLQHAQGIIAHSEYSKKLAQQWFGETAAHNWSIIPQLREIAPHFEKSEIKRQLGLKPDDILVCSFGFLDSTKLNDRLIDCWLASSLSKDPGCYLVFVGENHGGNYGKLILERIEKAALKNKIQITEFVTSDVFNSYLKASDIAVQLRTNSKGETSRAILDCMSHSIPVVLNANGSSAEIDLAAVWSLADEFDDQALIHALETLRTSPAKRSEIGERARRVILETHSPLICAQHYTNAIESFHELSKTALPSLIQRVADSVDNTVSDADVQRIASDVSITLPPQRPAKRLFLDITATAQNDLKTGIERVVRSLLVSLIENPPPGYRIEPIYLDHDEQHWMHRRASRFTLELLGATTAHQNILGEDVIEPDFGDIVLSLDLSGSTLVQAQQSGLFSRYRNRGVRVQSVIFDLLPVRQPDVFPNQANEQHENWLNAVCEFDGAICISKTVAEEFSQWRIASDFSTSDRRDFGIEWFHLGADVSRYAPTLGLPANAESILKQLQARPTFVMVGTVEPRKAYFQTLAALTHLWSRDLDINLVIVGKTGWNGLPDHLRRDIPPTVELLRNHSESGKRLFWLEGISDEFLEMVYAASTCLIAASYGEGFGLPLIEAAQHQLPVIARDIPVFREVAGEHAYYFTADNPEDLANAIESWLGLYQTDQHPQSIDMPWLTWEQSAAQLLRALGIPPAIC